ncbi:hypothetical protein CDL15_Pgr009376 [Punica granatum]|uniref:Uncharacterized protein n=1 Tax=Punica granatum TaxID=22663 RepID=A0A218WZ94_PUNGR|nr:hypothetical protein CDL15_Pgr009376 [Punica granatum]
MDSREPRGLTALPLRGSAERSHDSLGSISVSSPRIRGTSCYACMATRGMLPSLDAQGKESGKRLWESQDSGWTSRVGDPGEGAAAAVSGKRLGTLAPTTARCEVGFVGLLRGRSR